MGTSLLSLLESKDIRSTAQLAAAMGVSTEMVQAQLERYEQLGYVKKTVMGGGCGGGCKACRGCDGMKKQSEPVVFWEKVHGKGQAGA